MQKFFKQTVRQYAEEARRLHDIRKTLNGLYTKQQIEEGVLQSLTFDRRKATISSIGEFFIENNVFYTERQILDFVKEGLEGQSVEIQGDRLVAFFTIQNEQVVVRNSKPSIQKQLYIKLDIFQLLNQAIKSNLELNRMKEEFRTQFRIAALYKLIRKDYQNYADATSIAKFCDLDLSYVDTFMKALGSNKATRKQLYEFFDEEDLEQLQERKIVSIQPSKKQDILLQQQFLHQYIHLVVERMGKLETEKQDIINQYPNLSVEACFLMFASSLEKSIDLNRFQLKCDELGISHSQKTLYLFARRYGTNGKLTLESFKTFFTPVHESFYQILLRRDLKPLKSKEMQRFIKLFNQALKIQLQLQDKKFRQSNYGRLFMKIDRNQDTFLCRSDLTTFSKLHGKKIAGRQLAIIFNRFTQKRNKSRISYVKFVDELQQKLV